MLSRYDASGELFAGQYYDEETGMNYNFTRYYLPELGRYLKEDSIGLLGGINPHIFAVANPIFYGDPDGRRHRVTQSADGTIHVKLTIYLVGGAEENAKKWQEQVNADWNAGNPKYKGCPVVYDVKFVWADFLFDIYNDSDAMDAHQWKHENITDKDRGYNVVLVTHGPTDIVGTDRDGDSYVNDDGVPSLGNTGEWDETDPDIHVPSHEVGHLMGLEDRYKENDEGYFEGCNEGYNNSVMCQSQKPPHEDDIYESVLRADGWENIKPCKDCD